jgi:hypothetical protein
MIDRPYRLVLAVLPDRRVKAPIFILNDEQQEELERFAILTLEPSDWRRVDEAVFEEMAEVLTQETTEHLNEEK